MRPQTAATSSVAPGKRSWTALSFSLPRYPISLDYTDGRAGCRKRPICFVGALGRTLNVQGVRPRTAGGRRLASGDLFEQLARVFASRDELARVSRSAPASPGRSARWGYGGRGGGPHVV